MARKKAIKRISSKKRPEKQPLDDGKSIVIKHDESKNEVGRFKVGRPTLYEQRYCEMLVEHCEKGKSIEAFAGKIGVSIDTIYEWAKVHPEFSEAKKVAYAASLSWWEDFGQDNLLSTTESSGWAGAKDTSSKSLNSSVWIYNMKCRFRKQYTEVQKIKQIIDETSNQTKVIKLAYVPKSQRQKIDE